MAEDPVVDPYTSCERHCSHDLGGGVLIAELLGADGPHPPGYMVVNLAPRRQPARVGGDLELAGAPARG